MYIKENKLPNLIALEEFLFFSLGSVKTIRSRDQKADFHS